jgi:type I restriction enzyme S subunit
MDGIENSSTQILPVGTTIISARGTTGQVALVGVPMAINQHCYGLCSKAKTQGYFTYFATCALLPHLQQHVHGSVLSTITRNALKNVTIVVPPDEILFTFESKVHPLLERIKECIIESCTLTTLRDTLLPRLISGELRVPIETKNAAGKAQQAGQ